MGAITKPRRVVVGEADHRDGHEVAAIIPVDELQEARRESKWIAFRERALTERRELREQGRSS
jgi:hypothetical protein